jgi:hypothetical protein
LYGSFIRYSLPVLTGAFSDPFARPGFALLSLAYLVGGGAMLAALKITFRHDLYIETPQRF